MTSTAFPWREYLELAKQLQEDPQPRAARSAISRAYYAAFHHARLFVERHTSTEMPRDGAAHARVPEELQRMRPPRIQEANKLRELKRLRTWADYRAGAKPNLDREVQKAISHATQIIQRLS